MSIMPLLAFLKIGLYAPALYGPLGVWPYAAVNVVEQKVNHKILGLEVGYTQELKKDQIVFLGKQGVKLTYCPAWLLGVKYPVSNDLDIALGGKYFDDKVSPYAGVTFKFSAIKTGRD